MCPAAILRRHHAAHQASCVFTRVCYVHIDKLQPFSFPFLQFDEEFSARQEAQAEAQKKEEKIKELEEKIQALESQVNPLEEIPLNDFAK